ncbi:glycosyltransferase family 39 protein [Collimonas arenae]|uniref:glycosyltransferase family 39 protein n=1 Tax=Collimonas arenae TaxID=279058 RepID=UPI00155AC4B0|nr:glycosyltransferase family 39 protein [Collimonas arenae]
MTPFSAVPDEIGHYAYVQDIAYGKGIPVLSSPAVGKSLIGADIMGYVEKNTDAKPAYNWIAQHPPIYYALAAIPLKIGSWFTSDQELLLRLPRIVSALSGALLLLVLFQTFKVVGLDTPRANGLAAAIGFIPMVSHLSSGTTHDIPLFLFCALATYFFARHIVERQIKDAYWCATWLAIASGTKMMTPWVLLAPMIFFLIFELSTPNKIKHVLGISLTAFSIPIIWMVRNLVYFGNPLYTSGTERKPGLDVALNLSFLDFIHSQPAISQTINWFYGMFVYLGAGRENVLLQYDLVPRHLNFIWFAVRGFPYRGFLDILFFLLNIFLIYILKLLWKIFKKNPKKTEDTSLIYYINSRLQEHHYRKPLSIISVIVAVYFSIYVGSANFTNLSFLVLFSVVASIFLGTLSLPLSFLSTDKIDRVALYGFFINLFFSIIFLYHIYGAYLIEGQLRATQGRYFYPVIPLLLLSAAVAFIRLRVPVIVLNIIVTILACAELSTYILQVIPFYLKQYS